MAIRPVLKIGNPLLAKQSAPVGDIEALLNSSLIEDMLETMVAAKGAGIAAPQVGELKRIVIFGISKNPRYPDVEPVPTTVLINPVIDILSDEMSLGWEGCLSVPGFRGLVPRYHKIRYQGLDETGAAICREVEGFHARVVQHEVDHLDGILYPQRILNFTDFGLIEELEAAGRIPRLTKNRVKIKLLLM